MFKVTTQCVETLPRALRVLVAVCVMAAVACVPDFDTTRESRDDSSVGAAIYREMCERVTIADDPNEVEANPVCSENATPTASDSARLQALYAQRDRLISESNETLAAPVGSLVRTMLAQALPLYDAGTMKAATDGVDAWLADLEQDTNALAALERIAKREGYMLPSLTPGFMRVIMSFSGMGEMLDAGLAPITTTSAGTVSFANALSVVGPELDEGFDETDDPAHSWFLVRDFLMSSDSALNRGTARYIVQRGTDGVAVKTSVLATVSGTPFPVGDTNRSEKRDSYGRLLDSDGDPVFRYTNVEGTVLAALVRESARIAKTVPSAIGELALPLTSLMGPQKTRSQSYASGVVRFAGYDTSRSPLLDAAYALGVIAKKSSTAPALEALRQLLTDDEEAVAGTTRAIAVALQMLREEPYKDLKLEDDTAMVEEFLDVLAEILREPDLAEDLLTAIEDAHVKKLAPTMAHYMTYKDRIDYDPSDLNGPPTGTMQTKVDRSKPDLRDNRSIFQRFTHLLHDSSHATLCNKQGAVVTVLGISYPFDGGYDECELTQIDDVAIFHAESIIGKSTVVLKDDLLAAVATSSILELQSGIDGFGLEPTPEALDRFVFAPFNAYLSALYDPVPAFDGTPLKDRHNGTIFAWELEDFYSNIAPVIQAFYDHGRTDLFIDFFATVHRHYGSRDSDFTQATDPDALLYAPNTGIVRFEPVLAEAIATNPFAGMAKALATLRVISVDGVDGRARVLELARDLLLPERSSGLATRDNHRYIRNDGTRVTKLSPLHIVVDALRGLDDALQEDPDAYDALSDGLKGVIGGLLDSDGTTFASSDTAPLTADIIGFIHDRIQDHIDADDLASWANDLDDRFQDVIDQPLVQTLVPLVSLFASDPAAREQLDALLIHLADNSKDVNAYTSTIQGLADGMQLLDDEDDLRPLAQSLATAADPQDGMLLGGATLMQAMANRDTGRALARLLTRLVTHPDDDANRETPIEGMFDIMLDVNRSKPGASTARTKVDYAKTISTVRSFLNDPDRGLQRLYELIANR